MTTRHAGMAKEIHKLVEQRLAEVEDEKKYPYGPLLEKGSMVGKVIDGAVKGQNIVFGVGKATGTFYNVQSYIPVGEDVFSQKTQVYGAREDLEESLRRLNMLAKRLQPRAGIPVEPGVCVDGAILLDPPESNTEAVTLGVRIKEFSDVHFSLSMTRKNILVESDGVGPRSAKAEKDARDSGIGQWFSRIKVLRRGDRQVDGWKGEEVLVHKPAQKVEGESHELVFVSYGEPRNPYRPVLDIQLDTGVENNRTGARPPSVTDAEAVALWDRLISSIRARPTGL